MRGWEASALGRSDQAECSRPVRTERTGPAQRSGGPGRPAAGTGSSVLVVSVKSRLHLCQQSALPGPVKRR